jgi:small conductance mechanosensitive channel
MENVQKIYAMFVTWVGDYSLKVLAAVLILIVGRWLARKIADLLVRVLEKNKIDATLTGFLENIAYYALLVLVLIAAAGQLGINTASFLTIVGAAGLAVGLALKDSLSNFSAGVMLVLFRPFRIGDAVQAAGVKGKVVGINIFNTIINTPDNQRIIIPNNSITNDVIINITANPTRRIDLVAGIGYEDDIMLAKRVLHQILESDDRILKEPAPTIAVSELADSSVNIVVRPWVNTGDYWDVYFDLTEKIKMRFDAEGINIPYPQRDVHLFEEKPAA